MVEKRDGKLTQLAPILDRYLARHGILHKSREILAAVVWAEVVGPWYSQHTTVTRVSDGVLTVQCDSAPRAQQLQLDSDRILEKLNQRLGGNFIKEIRATSGRLGRGRQPGTGAGGTREAALPELQAQPLAPDQEQAIDDTAAQIADPELRERFVRVMRNFYRLEWWKQAHDYQRCPRCGRLIEQGEKCAICNPSKQPQQGNPIDDHS